MGKSDGHEDAGHDERRDDGHRVDRRAFVAGAAAAITVMRAGVAGASEPVVDLGPVSKGSRTLGRTSGVRTTPAPPPAVPAPPAPATPGAPAVDIPLEGVPGADATPAPRPVANAVDTANIVVDDPQVLVDQVPDRAPTLDDVPNPTDAPPVVGSDELVQHVARRLTFGPTPELIEEIRRLGPAQWIERQLRPDLIPDPEVEVALAGYVTLGMSNRMVKETDAGLALKELRHATVLRAVLSERQLFETMVDFWTNHLNTFVGKGWVQYFKTEEDRDVIRRHALGRFSDLLTASAKSPAMLAYLDNAWSRGNGGRIPNENYGRELLELHTLGVNGGYSEEDVRGASYVLTGWTYDTDATSPTRYEFMFKDAWHHTGAATVLGWSTDGSGGMADGESLLQYLARHESTATFLATKLARRFIGDDPPEEAIASTAAAYLAADTDIAATLRHLFGTKAFLSGGAPKLRRPFDLVASTLRSTGATVETDPRGDAAGQIDWRLRTFGQQLFSQPPPTGYPDEAIEWVSTDGLLRRWTWAVQLLRNQIKGVVVDEGALLSSDALLGSDAPQTAGELVDRVSSVLLVREISAEDRQALLDFLGVPAEAAVTDDLLEDVPLLGGLVLGSAIGQYR